MNIKVISGRLSFCNHRTPYVAKPNDQGVVKRSWVTNLICDNSETYVYNGKEYTGTIVEFEHDGVKHCIPHSDFLTKVMPLVWAEKGVPVPKVPFLNYAYARADQTVGLRMPKIDKQTGEYYRGWDAETFYFYGKTDADKVPVAPLIVDQKRQPLPAESGHPVSGDYVITLLSVYVFEMNKTYGVSASYNGMQYLRQGESFGAAAATASAFDEQEVKPEAVTSDDAADCF